MNKSEQNKLTALSALHEWSKTSQKIIVAIDGYSGAGKSTLVQDIENENSEYLIVHRDDFAIPRKDFENLFSSAKTEKAKVDTLVDRTINVEELAEFLELYRAYDGVIECELRGGKSGVKNEKKKFDFSKKVLILEGIFLLKHEEIRKQFDKKIFINIDQNTADERRRKREMEKWGDDYFPETHPNSYFKYIKIGFNDYLEVNKPTEQADLVIESN